MVLGKLWRGISGQPGDDDLRKIKKPEFDRGAFDNSYEADIIKSRANKRMNAAAGREAPQMNAATLGPAAQVDNIDVGATDRSAQNNLLDTLSQRAMGGGSSVADLNTRFAQDQALSQAAAPNSALGMRMAQQQVGAQNQQVGNQGAGQRLNEIMQSESALGQTIAQQRSQDIQERLAQDSMDARLGIANAGATNQFNLQQGQFDLNANMANADARLDNQQQIDALMQFYETQGLTADRAYEKALMDGALLDEQAKGARDQARAQMVAQGKANRNNLIGNIVGGGTSAAAMSLFVSDERQKENIKPASDKIGEFLEHINSYEYNYKNTKKPGTAPGKRTGIIAQDLQKSEAGKELVEEVDGSLMINTQQGFGTLLAALGEINKRLKKVEGDD